MKKKLILLSMFIAMVLSGAGIYSMNQEQPHQVVSEENMLQLELVNNETQFTLVTIEGNKITFYDPLLRNELEANGIAIPPSEQERYSGKEKVTVDDPDFARAFHEFYSKFVFGADAYTWQPLSS